MKPEAPLPGITREEFLQSVAEAGVLSIPEVAAGEETSGNDLAQKLVDEGKLTRYQADALLTRRFTDLVMGNYEILDKLGSGGMGTVYKARHRRMKRVVALKLLSRESENAETFRQRFQREVETIARLSHPNIVMAFDADEAKAGPFLVMEFINGCDLATEVAMSSPLSVADAVDCTLQAARGLEYAHSQKIIHRDIKPGNLLRDSTGLVKVGDLGLARLNSPNAMNSLTQSGSILGTLDYLPPEQATSATVIDHRVDIYSLGCTLYYLLTGRPPYQAKSVLAMLGKHRDAEIPSVSAERHDVPPELDIVFRKMLAKKPEDRQQTMTEVVRALEGLKASVPLSDTRPARRTATLGTPTNLNRSGATLPYNATAPHGGTADNTMSDPPGSVTKPLAGRRVVLAEPSRTLTEVVREYLEHLGAVTIHTTRSGAEALTAAKQERADAIVCSMHLHDMTAQQLSETMLADPACAKLAIVIATSKTDTVELTALPKSPRLAVMPKPFDPERLAQALTSVLDEPGA
jgi:serine/threonine-protein kinase